MFTVAQILPQTILFRFCMVCGRFLGLKEGKGVRGITHGICPECLKQWEEKKGKRKGREEGRAV